MTKKERDKKRAAFIRRDPFGRLTQEINRYLGTVGWRAFVIGDARVQQQPGERKYNYEFVVKFTGDRIEQRVTKKAGAATE